MRTKFVYRCTECKDENYIGARNRTTHPDKSETQKFCRKCNAKTLHREKSK